MSSLDNSGLSFGAVAMAAPKASAASGLTKTPPHTAVDDFLSYMKESAAERMADTWLAAHGLTRDALKAMSPERREAVLKQMAKEIADQLKQAASEGEHHKRL